MRRMQWGWMAAMLVAVVTNATAAQAQTLRFDAQTSAAVRARLTAARLAADSAMRRAPGPVPVVGRPDAPVTVEEFADLQCPACAAHQKVTEPVLADLVNKGVVRIVYWDLPLPFHQNAMDAAMVAHCTGSQGYLGARAMLFASQQEWGESSDMPNVLLRQVSRVVGVDTARVRTCYDEGPYLAVIRFGLEEATRRKVTATPTIFVAGRPLVGVVAPDQLRRTVDELLTGVVVVAPNVPAWKRDRLRGQKLPR